MAASQSAGGCCGPSRTSVPPAVGPKSSRAPLPEGSGRRGQQPVWLEGGRFLMGNEDAAGRAADGEGPVREVTVSAFGIDARTVTNADFAEFCAATGYRTESEVLGWSFVFAGHLDPAAARHVLGSGPAGTPWWLPVHGASWTSPRGPGSGIEDLLDHPVVQVSWPDAAAYAAWAGKRLPTEAEWEYAARGGLRQARYPWGDELTDPRGEHRCNIWQGTFPLHNTAEDGHHATAPADSYAPNAYGLFQCVGNVWEWCADWFSPTWHVGARPDTRVDPGGPPTGTERVIRGGSHLCHDSYCNRYRVAARTGNTPDSATSHTGFRCATDSP